MVSTRPLAARLSCRIWIGRSKRRKRRAIRLLKKGNIEQSGDFPHQNESHPMDHDSNSSGRATYSSRTPMHFPLFILSPHFTQAGRPNTISSPLHALLKKDLNMLGSERKGGRLNEEYHHPSLRASLSRLFLPEVYSGPEQQSDRSGKEGRRQGRRLWIASGQQYGTDRKGLSV